MDSLPNQEINRLRTFKTAGEMADYLLRVISDAELGDGTYTIYPVFLSPQNKIAFDKTDIPKMGKKALPGSDRLDLTEDEPDEEHELIIFYARHIIHLGSTIKMSDVEKRGNLYEQIRTKITRDLKNIAKIVKRENEMEKTLNELTTMLLGAPLEKKKEWLELHVKKKK